VVLRGLSEPLKSLWHCPRLWGQAVLVAQWKQPAPERLAIAIPAGFHLDGASSSWKRA